MDSAIRPLIAGNWKMNGVTQNLSQLEALTSGLVARAATCDVLICPPATLVRVAATTCADGPVLIGGQDCHFEKGGAHTGDISADMLVDAGAKFVIVGHSERRADHHESSALVRTKAQAAQEAGLVPIICVGETQDEKLAGRALEIVTGQLTGSVPDIVEGGDIVIAYEPVWAIGTGMVPTSDDIANMHGAIRDWLAGRFGADGATIRILYGGSLKPSNADQILPLANVNGGLIGGASLKAEDLLGIIDAL